MVSDNKVLQNILVWWVSADWQPDDPHMAYDSLVADPAVAFIQIFNDSMSAVMFVLRYMDETIFVGQQNWQSNSSHLV